MAKTLPMANRAPRLRQGVPEGYGMVYPSGTILGLFQILGLIYAFNMDVVGNLKKVMEGEDIDILMHN